MNVFYSELRQHVLLPPPKWMINHYQWRFSAAMVIPPSVD